ncbi:conserved membrane protein of unknown function [Tenacibaculum soleae]|uniref:hypothetical protein n=1 Tax=Tenacibaculum soleae TaxID=447689 RepID=UPI0026E156DC|nr:hypothetical protein [Tenacibaculum soleae]MDO6743610.1 hypothetical protein [Tenacibaculum soleae]
MSVFGYILLFYVGFYFYRLAENYNRNKWLYAFLGLVFFFIGCFGYVMYVRFFEMDEIQGFDIAMISIKSVGMGILFSFVMFHFIDFIWKKNK